MNAEKTPKGVDDARRDWACWAYESPAKAPVLIVCSDRRTAEELAETRPHLTVTSRTPGEPYPDPAPVNLAMCTTRQRAQLLAALLADHEARDAALAGLSPSDLHDLSNTCDTLSVPMEEALLVEAVREGVAGIPAVQHVRFGAHEQDDNWAYDPDEACLFHTDGGTVSYGTFPGARNQLAKLSKLTDTMGEFSTVTVTLATGRVVHDCIEAPDDPSTLPS